MSEFKPGQTVWSKGSGARYEVLAAAGDSLWLIDPHASHVARLHDARDFVATNAEPTPQKCPFCGDSPHCHDYADGDWQARCDQNKTGCGCKGPYRKTRLEAIRAWNAIRIGNDIDDAIADVLKCNKPADSEPLTEDWLRKVDLYTGVFRLTWRGPGEQRLAFMIKGHRSDCEWAFCPAYCKTREDVRTLCRLLGVPLEE